MEFYVLCQDCKVDDDQCNKNGLKKIRYGFDSCGSLLQFEIVNLDFCSSVLFYSSDFGFF